MYRRGFNRNLAAPWALPSPDLAIASFKSSAATVMYHRGMCMHICITVDMHNYSPHTRQLCDAPQGQLRPIELAILAWRQSPRHAMPLYHAPRLFNPIQSNQIK